MFYVYILSSRRRGTLYTGVTSDVPARIHAHREGIGSKFAKRYVVLRLVCVQPFPTALEAIAQEKRLKKWRRLWKIRLIERENPNWRDLC